MRFDLRELRDWRKVQKRGRPSTVDAVLAEAAREMTDAPSGETGGGEPPEDLDLDELRSQLKGRLLSDYEIAYVKHVFAIERAKKEAAEAARKEIGNEIKLGTLVPATEVERAVNTGAEVLRRFGDRLERDHGAEILRRFNDALDRATKAALSWAGTS